MGIRLIVPLMIMLIAAYAMPAQASPASYVSVFISDAAGHPIAGETVTALPLDDRAAIVAITTDTRGMADLGDLRDGDWMVTACGQQFDVNSTDGPTGGLIAATCHRVLLPTVSR